MPSYTIIPQTTLRKTQSEAIAKYIKMISVNNSRTGNEYLTRLITFETYIKEHYPFSLDELTINKLFNYRENIYELLADYVSWLSQRIGKDGYKLSNVSIKQRVITAKNFLEFFDIDINPRKFKLKVKMPRVVMQYKEALAKEDIIKILEACGKLKLKTYLLFLAATGCRASEACSIRIKDLDFVNSKVNIRGEFTKTKVGRYMFLTEELKEYLKTWLDYKYRERRLYLKDKHCNRRVKPEREDYDLVFSSSFTYNGDTYSNDKDKKKKISELDNVSNLYTTLVIDFNKVIEQLKIGYENSSRRRHIFTMHSLRRWVKGTISDIVSSDYSEWALGHTGSYSTYYRKSEKEKYALFKKVEPYLTYLDQRGLEKKQADLQNRLELMENENREMRDRMNQVFEMIQQNPALANVKPEVLTEKKRRQEIS